MNRKASTFLLAQKTFWMLFTLLIIAGGIVSLSIFLAKDSILEPVKDLKGEIFTEQLISSPECFAHKDAETEKLGFGMIDKDAFTDEQLQLCLYFGEYVLPAKATLINKDTGETTIIQTPQFAEVSGLHTTVKGVLIKNESGLYNGTVLISINLDHVKI